MMGFATALQFVLNYEGGYSNIANDRGGPTNMGITQATYDDWRIGRGEATVDVRYLRMEEAAEIYKSRYWIVGHCPSLPDRLATVHFDACVQHGLTRAAKFLQQAVGVPEDGIIGPETLQAVNSIASEPDVVNAYLQERRDFYDAIIANDPTQARFAHGWDNRIDALEKEVA